MAAPHPDAKPPRSDRNDLLDALDALEAYVTIALGRTDCPAGIRALLETPLKHAHEVLAAANCRKQGEKDND